MREVLNVVGVIAAVGACVWLYLKLLAFSDERGIRCSVHDPRVDPPKVEIQSLFHGNTKDEDQI
jgi:hypothetical protein